jgi:uncharacterized repeat protein (TIGR03803 family)
MKNALQHRNWISGLTLAVLSALLLIAARPAQALTTTVLYTFTGGSDGGGPNATLIADDEGNLYGTTVSGGQFGQGTVFELSPNGSGGWNESVLYSFCSKANCADGASPEYSSLISDENGNLYGTASQGGANGDGAVFELSPGTPWTEQVLYNFGSYPGDGISPVNGLIVDSQDNLYGTTEQGGTNGTGTVFELSAGVWTEQVLYDVDNTSGEAETAGLAMDPHGNIFGITPSTVYELKPNGSGGWNPSVIYKNSGLSAQGTLVFNAGLNGESENLYGTTGGGGLEGFGTIYELTLLESGKWKSKSITNLKWPPVSDPWAGVVVDAAGNIYGTSLLGGEGEAGDVFELLAPVVTGGYDQEVLGAFFFSSAGYSPYGGLLLNNGFLYGTNSTGENGVGDVFAVTQPGAKTLTTLTSSPNPSADGQAVVFTATVTSNIGVPPDGEPVSFMKGKTLLGTGTLSSGVATFAISTLKVGTTSVKAVYGGDNNFQGSTSKPVKQVVN